MKRYNEIREIGPFSVNFGNCNQVMLLMCTFWVFGKCVPYPFKIVGEYMNIHTKYHGEITIEESDIIQFENGIPGFLHEQEFIILPLTEDGIYSVMQSVRTSQLAFVITNPFIFYKDYDFTLEDVIVKQLGIEAITDVKVFNILTLQEPFEKTTVNLQAPIIINTKNNQAKQVILNNESYKTKHPLFIESPDSIKG